MKGKEHMIVGTTATATMGIGFLITKTFDSALYLVPLIIGGFIGSYMPDIDSHNSIERQVFNKIYNLIKFEEAQLTIVAIMSLAKL